SNISPQEVEGALVEHPSVASAAVIGIHDTLHGENVRAYIALKEGAGRPPSQELIQFARARVGYKAPEEIVVLEDMPITATGKLDRTYLKRMAKGSKEWYLSIQKRKGQVPKNCQYRRRTESSGTIDFTKMISLQTDFPSISLRSPF